MIIEWCGCESDESLLNVYLQLPLATIRKFEVLRNKKADVQIPTRRRKSNSWEVNLAELSENDLFLRRVGVLILYFPYLRVVSCHLQKSLSNGALLY